MFCENLYLFNTILISIGQDTSGILIIKNQDIHFISNEHTVNCNTFIVNK